MTSTKYIGMDVHMESISIAVMTSVGYERIRGGRERGFADSDAGAKGEHLWKAASKTTAGDGAAAVDVREAADRNSEKGVEDGEAEAQKQADLRVANAEIAAKRTDEEGEDLTVDEGEDVDDREDRDDESGVTERAGRLLRRGESRRIDGNRIGLARNGCHKDALFSREKLSHKSGCVQRKSGGLARPPRPMIGPLRVNRSD